METVMSSARNRHYHITLRCAGREIETYHVWAPSQAIAVRRARHIAGWDCVVLQVSDLG